MEDWVKYTEAVTVQESDVDYRGLMKPSALLRYAEHMATRHSHSKGMGDDFFRANHLAYLLGKQALQFHRVPQKGEKLLLTTLPERSRRGTNKRILQVEDAAGTVIAQVDARWILVDTETGRVLRRPPEQLDSLWNPEIPYELPQTIHKAETLTSAGIWPASYSRCDINGHINNACYLDIACDALPLEVIQQGPIRSAAVKYHREVPLGQEMEVFWGKTETGWYVMGRREGQASFELEYQW